ncbi:MAG: protein-L-isoaspartate(D-aspartate) O-methyltransferase [Pseudomonadales bacterium]|nr:protein-L-isoaspartate(D-aspartate) O-methyltransferase [Pseudomonadales bacterium]
MTSKRTRERLLARLREQGIGNERVLAAIGAVPRHAFVDEALAHRAYEDTALPIGLGQTLSQPFVVALMTQTLLDVARPRVLEVGTGSGYQTAILARMRPDVRRIFTVERHAVLAERAETRLTALRITGARFRHGDGYEGWPEEGPFDGILVTAAPPSVPQALLEQLKVGGRLVVPVGGEDIQELQVVDRTARGYRVDTVEYVRFVPLLKGKR